jgi:hypothetical protein
VDDLVDGGQFDLLEIANGHHFLDNQGDDTHPSSDQLWDAVLASGRQVWGVASDDAHHFRHFGPTWANPGRGWLQVEAESPRIHDCLEALRQGRFYASTGLELLDYRASAHDLALELATGATRIELVGIGGRILETVEGRSARFSLRAVDSPYVRVRAGEWDTGKLWTQPIFL